MFSRYKLLIALLAGAALSLLSGCAGMSTLPVETHVDGISASTAATKKRYFLLPGDKSVQADDLQFLEFSSIVEQAMSQQGFTRANTPADSDLLVFLTYGIGDPQKQLVSYSVPVWGQTGISSSSSTGTLRNVGGGVATYSGMTTYNPTYGVTGYTTNIGEITTYFRFVLIDAYDTEAYSKDGSMRAVWKTKGESTGRYNDLRLVFPPMIATMKPHIGRNTGRKVTRQLTIDSKEVKDLLQPKEMPSSKQQMPKTQ
jgi:hypothetical protein